MITPPVSAAAAKRAGHPAVVTCCKPAARHRGNTHATAVDASRRDAGLQDKLSLVKRRIDPNNILNDPDIESGGRQNIFVPGSGTLVGIWPESSSGWCAAMWHALERLQSVCWLRGPCLLCVHMQVAPHCGAFVPLICPLSSDINMLPCLLQADSVNPTTANKGQGVSFRGSSSTAPSLQVNVDFERAADKVRQRSVV
jgi:hypothetical protein